MPGVEPSQFSLLASRGFMPDDQAWFAVFSGDRNPMHMDPVAARRTQAGEPVVHGIHLLLWSVEQLCARHPNLPPPRAIQVRFDKFCYVGDTVEIWIADLTPQKVRFELRIDDVATSLIHIDCGELADPASLLTGESPILWRPRRGT